MLFTIKINVALREQICQKIGSERVKNDIVGVDGKENFQCYSYRLSLKQSKTQIFEKCSSGFHKTITSLNVVQ